jgi:hypothetical protein
VRFRRTQLIRERSALTRQVINFFQMHLLGVYRWDEATVLPALPIPRPVYEIGLTRDEREARRDDRKVHDMVAVKFGPFELIAKGPYEDAQHPCGLIRVTRGDLFVEGPLDEATWKKVGDFIKQKEENDERSSSAAAEPALSPGEPDEVRARAPWGC